MAKPKKSPECPYCGGPAEKVTGEVIYPLLASFWDRKFWACLPCDAYVGTHKHTGRPLGVLANKELRQARIEAHDAFDRIWQRRFMTRAMAYQWLSAKLGVEHSKCHIGMFDLVTCRKVAEVSREFLDNECKAKEQKTIGKGCDQ